MSSDEMLAALESLQLKLNKCGDHWSGMAIHDALKVLREVQSPSSQSPPRVEKNPDVEPGWDMALGADWTSVVIRDSATAGISRVDVGLEGYLEIVDRLAGVTSHSLLPPNIREEARTVMLRALSKIAQLIQD